MKHFLILLLSVSPFVLRGQCLADESPKMLKKALPEAWVPIQGDYIWMHCHEMTNQGYMEFLWHVRETKGEDYYKSMLPDTSCWRKNHEFGEPFEEFYLRHPAYKKYPVVGVSYSQAQAYCEFATEAINQHLKLNSKGPIQEVLVRLPTEIEWEMAARAGNNRAIYPWGTESLRQPKGHKFEGQYLARFRISCPLVLNAAGSLNESGDVIAPSDAYWSNPWGLYNMSGNVAEMVQEEGVAKGGSWNSFGYDLRIDTQMEYNQDLPYLGFRPLLEVVKFRSQGVKMPVISAKFIESSLKNIAANSYLMGGEIEISGASWWFETSHARPVSVQSFHVWETEIPNWLYNEFLKDVLTQDPKLEEAYRVRDENWITETTNALMQQYSKHERFAFYPVVNVSYSSAIAFCEWLTRKYIALPGKRFQNMEFRLPNEVEWECAARGGLQSSPFPWTAPYEMNSKGCYLANYNPVPDSHLSKEGKYVRRKYPVQDSTISRKLDGAVLTAPVNSYQPNGFGLYNMAGNVAEMLQGSYSSNRFSFAHDLNPNDLSSFNKSDSLTLVRGGSFSSMSYCLLVAARDFAEVDRMKKLGLDALPTIGFRVVMVPKTAPIERN